MNMSNIATNLKQIQQSIHACADKYGRSAQSICLLAVSKKQSIKKIKAAADGGQKAFGENFLQEALEKIQQLKALNLEWHFIGTIQSNKTKSIAENFHWAHSITREKIAQRLNDQRPEQLSPLNVCIEVNVDHEATKAGIDFVELNKLATLISQLPRLNLRGLMAIPKVHEDFNEQRKPFAKLRQAFEQLKKAGFELDTLSMGMSADYEAAIAEGATIIRIGTALFGARE